MHCIPSGPASALIALVGEAPGAQEEIEGKPFVGASGAELTRMLKDAGLDREAMWISNCVMDRPPDNKIALWIKDTKKQPDPTWVKYRGRWVRPNVKADIELLRQDLQANKPKVIIAAGSTALWALTPHRSVDKWRSSYLQADWEGGPLVIPVYHPANVLRNYPWRSVTVQDLRRARVALTEPPVKPNWRFTVSPTYETALRTIENLKAIFDNAGEPRTLVCDLEIKRGEVVCLGIAWTRLDAICITYYGPQGKWFTNEQAAEVNYRLWELFNHPNCRLSNQNIGFDIFYLFEKLGFWPRASFDTMIAQNVLFPTGGKIDPKTGAIKKTAGGIPKSLDFLASMYCDWYVYWKDDGKFWNKPIIWPQLWEYNCRDCVHTFEVQEHQEKALARSNLTAQMAEQVTILNNILPTMFRGVRVDQERRRILAKELKAAQRTCVAEAEFMAGMSLSGDKGGLSAKKLKHLFYERLGIKPIMKKVKGKMAVTCDDDALKEIGAKDALLYPLTSRINMARSYATAIGVCQAKLSRDGRLRCSYNVAGTSTYRMSSSENPVNEGTNLQNITSGKEITV